jgi:photosystem II stability/assembly factor-like uncharacterized protein
MLCSFLCALFLVGGAAALPRAAEAVDQNDAWVPLGPPDSSVQALVVHPRNPRILWAGTFTAGVFRSVDGGVSWTASRQLIGVPILTLAVAPGDPRILYATAPAFLGGLVGVIRSSDGGQTWAAVVSCPANGVACQRLASTHELDVDPRDAQIVYASSDRGLFKSVDGGRRWRPTGRGRPTSTLAIDPANPRILWAGGSDGVSRSEDGGATWVSRKRGIGAASIEEIAIDPRNPSRLWAAGPGISGVYRTADAGARWRLGDTGLQENGVLSLALSAAPGQNLPVVWAGTFRGVFRSQDGGLRWTGAPALASLPVFALAAHPRRSDTVWAGSSVSFRLETRSGIYKSVDGGATWSFSSRGLFGPPILALAFDPATPGVVWAAAGLAGVLRSSDGGSTWTPRNHGLGADFQAELVLDVAIDPRDPQTVWIGTDRGVYRTGDGGATWEARNEGLTLPGGGPTAINTVRPTSSPSLLYASSDTRLFRSTDEGAHWAPVFAGDLGGSAIADVLVDPRDPDVVFLAAGDLLVSRDGGAAWETVPLGPVPPVIQRLALDPRNPDVLFAGGGNGLFRSADGGRAWQQVRPAAVQAVTVGPTSEIWVVTVNGIHRSLDGVLGWASVPDLQGGRILTIAVDPHDPEAVFLGTSAGVFRRGF